jgi:hypothetical protein
MRLVCAPVTTPNFGVWRADVADIAAWVAEVGVVEDVGVVGADVEVDALAEGEGALDGEVGAVDAGSLEGEAGRGAELADGDGREGGGVEPFVQIPAEMGQVGVGDDVWALAGGGGVVVVLVDADGLAGLELDDAGELPSADDVLDDRCVVGEAASAAEGKLVDEAVDESVGDVGAGDALLGVEVVGVLDGRAVDAVVGVDVIDGFGVGVAGGEDESVAPLVLELGLDGLVVGTALVAEELHVGVLREWAEGLVVGGLELAGLELVDGVLDGQLDAVVVDVVDVGEPGAELVLDAELENEGVGSAGAGVDFERGGGGVAGSALDGSDGAEAGWDFGFALGVLIIRNAGNAVFKLEGRGVAVGALEGGVLLVFGERPDVVEADGGEAIGAEAAAEDGVFDGAPFAADARQEVGEDIGLEMGRRAVDAGEDGVASVAGLGVDGGGAEAGELVVGFGVGSVELPAQAEVHGEIGGELPVVLDVDGAAFELFAIGVEVGDDVGRAGDAEEQVGEVEAAGVGLEYAHAIDGRGLGEGVVEVVGAGVDVVVFVPELVHLVTEVAAELDVVATALEQDIVDEDVAAVAVVEGALRAEPDEVGGLDVGELFGGHVGEAEGGGECAALVGVVDLLDETEAEIVGGGGAEDVSFIGDELVVVPAVGVVWVGGVGDVDDGVLVGVVAAVAGKDGVFFA